LELAIVVVAIFLIFRRNILTALEANAVTIAKNAAPLAQYFGSTIVLTFTLSILPKLYVMVYMRSEGFYAYEVFAPGSGGYSVLAGNIFFNYLVLTFGFFGAAMLWAGKIDRRLIALVALVNSAFVALFVLLAFELNQLILVAAMLSLSLLLSVYLYYWISSGIEGRARLWYVPLIFSFLLLFAPIAAPTLISRLTAQALAQMKVGGMLVDVQDASSALKSDSARSRRWLILRTPDALYLKDAQDSKLVSVLRSDSFSVAPARD
jgi:hypothetical protein